MELVPKGVQPATIIRQSIPTTGMAKAIASGFHFMFLSFLRSIQLPPDFLKCLLLYHGFFPG
jgi:hypothetical protein